MPVIPSLKLIGYGAVALAIAVLIIALRAEKHHSAKLSERNAVLSSKLDQLAQESKDRQAEVGRRIESMKRVDPRVEIVEKAPLPGQCRTPPQVLEADI